MESESLEGMDEIGSVMIEKIVNPSPDEPNELELHVHYLSNPGISFPIDYPPDFKMKKLN